MCYPARAKSEACISQPSLGSINVIAPKPKELDMSSTQPASQMDAIKNEIDPAFINDQYWLILPFHVVWDGATVTTDGAQKLSLSGASAERIVVKYPSDGGYEPGDTWDLYVGADKRIVEIAYHHGANKPPKLVIATWADHKKAGPLLAATDHRGTFDGRPRRGSISDLSVKVTGSENWINEQVTSGRFAR